MENAYQSGLQITCFQITAHDQRDLDFARAMKLPIKVVVDTNEEDPAISGIATTGDGKLINSDQLNGLNKADAIAKIISILDAKNLAKAANNYRLRDWLISRQRYWGTPIPIMRGSAGTTSAIAR